MAKITNARRAFEAACARFEINNGRDALRDTLRKHAGVNDPADVPDAECNRVRRVLNAEAQEAEEREPHRGPRVLREIGAKAFARMGKRK
jgi:hypothetical protein